MIRSLFLVSIVALVPLSAAAIDLSPFKPAQDQELEAAINETMARWHDEIAPQIKEGNALAWVMGVMKGKYIDTGTICWGGTGDYSQFFLIDDFIVIRVELSVIDKVNVSGVSVYRKSHWLKEPDGRLRINPCVEGTMAPQSAKTERK